MIRTRAAMAIRNYAERDAAAIVRLFYETVHSVNLKDYSQEQVEAWAPEVPDAALWHARMSRRRTLVAEENGEVIAFAELEPSGHLDMFYCRKDGVGRGVGRSVGRSLYRAVEAEARKIGLDRISTEASITARPFFERCGFRVLGRQTVVRRGVELENFRMEKRLAAQ